MKHGMRRFVFNPSSGDEKESRKETGWETLGFLEQPVATQQND